MRHVGIITYYGTNNAGTFLQCFATQLVLSQLGYHGELIRLKNALLQRCTGKIARILIAQIKALQFPDEAAALRCMGKSMRQVVQNSRTAAEVYAKCEREQLSAVSFTPIQLWKKARSGDYLCFLSGSDQIWNPTPLALISRYFLRFAPEKKRIAFAPSFGVSQIPAYNYGVLRKYLSEYASLSVRELDGVRMVFELTGKTAVLLPDPVFLLDGQEWRSVSKARAQHLVPAKPYFLLYFLNEPSESAIALIHAYLLQKGGSILTFQYDYPIFSSLPGCSAFIGNPFDFVQLISNAEMVFTDSFHATAFALLTHRPFLTFNRQYGHKFGQESRIISLLKQVQMENCFFREDNTIVQTKDTAAWDFSFADQYREKQAICARQYLQDALRRCEGIK